MSDANNFHGAALLDCFNGDRFATTATAPLSSLDELSR